MKGEKKDTKKQILKTAGRLFAQRGYFGVSMQDIADELEITKAALYYHFKSKNQLAEILLKNASKELKKALKKAVDKSLLPSDYIFNLIKAFLDFKIKYPEIVLLTSIGALSDERQPIFQLAADIRKDLISFVRGLIDQLDFARRLTYRYLIVLASSLIGFVLSPFYSEKKDTNKAARDLTDLLMSKDIDP